MHPWKGGKHGTFLISQLPSTTLRPESEPGKASTPRQRRTGLQAHARWPMRSMEAIRCCTRGSKPPEGFVSCHGNQKRAQQHDFRKSVKGSRYEGLRWTCLSLQDLRNLASCVFKLNPIGISASCSHHQTHPAYIIVRGKQRVPRLGGKLFLSGCRALCRVFFAPTSGIGSSSTDWPFANSSSLAWRCPRTSSSGV